MVFINSIFRNLISLLLLLLFTYGCKADDKFKILKSTQTFKIKIDNSNLQSIGYKFYNDDMDIGVNSICKSGSNIYISDPYHNNIKVLNINTGDIKTSPKLFPWITDIITFKKKICVISEYDGLKVLNNELIASQHIKLPKGYKFFINFQNNIYIINATAFKKDGDKMAYQAFKLKTILENVPPEQIYLSFKSLPIKFGYFDKEKEINGKTYLTVGETYYEIPNKLKQVEGYDAYNVYVDKNEIVYFYFEKNELIINIFFYK